MNKQGQELVTFKLVWFICSQKIRPIVAKAKHDRSQIAVDMWQYLKQQFRSGDVNNKFTFHVNNP